MMNIAGNTDNTLELDDGFQFGLGIFETICLRDGEPLLLPWHIERMKTSLAFFQISQSISEGEVFAWLQEQRTDQMPQMYGLHALKIMITEKNKLFAFRGNPYTEERISQGFQVDYSPIRRNETSPLVYHKTMNYGDNILEKRRTHQSGIDEFLFLNSRGEICEGSTTNIFFVKNQKLYTPRLTCGMLPGIMRRFVMEHFEVEEQCLTPEDAAQMDECFLTNSLMGIMPVTVLKNQHFGAGSMTKQVAKKYADIV